MLAKAILTMPIKTHLYLLNLTQAATGGTVNTGGGGGGNGTSSGNGGAGGSGVVIVRYEFQ